MAIHVALNHSTKYRYERPVTLGPQIVRLRPAPHCRSTILGYSLRVTPAKHFINWQQDPHGNYQARLVFPEKTREFAIEVDLVAEMAVLNPFDFFLESAAEKFPFQYELGLRKDLAPFLEAVPAGPRLREFLDSISRTETRTNDFIVALNHRLQQEIKYIIRLEPGVQTPEETLTSRSGSCRDTGWLLVQVLRHLGLAARFVSGYLVQLTADVKALDGPSGTAVDFTDLHAWTEVYLPGGGWIGLDPTSGLLAGEGHIPLACTPDPSSAAPVTGVVEKCETEFSFGMTVQRIYESPRVTKPYSEKQWAAIGALGHRIDAELQAGDVRLTMGGEPTFVSIDDVQGAEWNTTAIGPAKRKLADTLVKRLKTQFGSGGLLHYGQGKWFPGEPLPRWALSYYWRKDGTALWNDETLVADDARDYDHSAKEAGKFIKTLASQLGVKPEFALAAHEDAWQLLWNDRVLPVSAELLKQQLDDSGLRSDFTKRFTDRLGAVVGFALPLARGDDKPWRSQAWLGGISQVFVVPGDSPIGYRLPLDILDRSGPDVIRSTLCVQARGGRLYVFLPPIEPFDAYMELVTAIEATAKSLKLPVILEGYQPPHDDRVNNLNVSPDPGVIEVNIHPARTWDEMVKTTTTVYEEARLSRLGTEKFMIDGRHVGTGGGNHIVIGGATLADSPLLRRPTLLRSLIGYWHNHPSLSYLFSGLFIGPTSQHPRVDEGRHDYVYEMEIAFQQIPDNDQVLPWLVDRVFRNILVDVTGNTHRAEFCIDKLFPPESAGGRKGLLELRAFEMPPHARMSLTQQLLLRALIAKFWNQPYRQKLVRWGTELHDRFMLPHFVAQDFRDVIDELPFEFAWFAPHFEFRFPFYGEVTAREVHLELRQALEPWHVLGEEGAPGGTVRCVDSSVERLQVKVTGLIDSRHVVTCNGRRLPLHPTGNVGEYVAGVRYRAWQPAACLHPTIPVQAPLVFDIVDTWNNHAIAGCTYHVAHPGGRSYDTFPVNAYEAESRRLARFLKFGHTPGPLTVPAAERNPDFPFTLDLRRA
ncbi:MAG: transglutaminase family protein [Verrucomicrobiota bacterium]